MGDEQYGLVVGLLNIVKGAYGLHKDLDSANKVVGTLIGNSLGFTVSAYRKLCDSYCKGELGKGVGEVLETFRDMCEGGRYSIQNAGWMLEGSPSTKKFANFVELYGTQQKATYDRLG